MTTELTRERGMKILPYLVQAAKARRLISYGELAAKIGVHQRVLAYPLGYIRDEICAPRGLPLITCIVVNKEKLLPGPEWLPGGTSRLSPQEYRRTFDRYSREVFDYTRWDDLLKDLHMPRAARAGAFYGR